MTVWINRWGIVTLALFAIVLMIIYVERGFDPLVHVSGIILAILSSIEVSGKTEQK